MTKYRRGTRRLNAFRPAIIGPATFTSAKTRLASPMQPITNPLNHRVSQFDATGRAGGVRPLSRPSRSAKVARSGKRAPKTGIRGGDWFGCGKVITAESWEGFIKAQREYWEAKDAENHLTP